jgi:hypothetical protein
MPTISQLPVAPSVAAGDTVPISQDGAAHSVSVGTLLSATQPAIVVDQGTLLGRTSLGPGGPEQIAVGNGLILNASTLQVALATGASSGASVRTLPLTTNPVAQDLFGINQSGTDRAITYATLINGQTIDAAQPATAVSDGDTFWVAQGSNTMVSQTFSAVWPWIASKLVSFKSPVIEVRTNTTLDGTIHNARLLVCSQPIALTPIPANMGNGFQCDIVNLSSGSVTLAGSAISSTGVSALAPGQAATLRCLTYSGGTVVYAFMGNGSLAVPGQVSALSSSIQTSDSIALNWIAPGSGAIATGYIVEYRPTGTSGWSVVNQAITATTYTVLGLTPTTSYDFCVLAANSVGSGNGSSVLTVFTASVGNLPGTVIGLTTSNATPSSLQLNWQAPTSGTAPTSYTIQYRATGGTTWTGTIAGVSGSSRIVSGLNANTAYDFGVIAVAASGSVSLSAIATGSTTSQSGSVTSIVWNVAPSGSYTRGSGAIGVNVHVAPSTAAVQFGFANSATAAPSSWTAGSFVNTDLWGAYVPTPATAGTWYAWAAGTDGSAPTSYATPFMVS